MFIKNFIIFFGWVSVVIGTSLIVIVVYWLLHDYKPITFRDPYFPVSKTTVYQGEEIHYTSRYCKPKEITSLVTRSFVNSIIFVTPSTINNRPAGCHDVRISVLVPLELPPGRYHMHQIYVYRVNPIRDVKVEMDTNSFIVKEATYSAHKSY